MPSRIADAESRLVSKCRKCGRYFWLANSVPPAECEPYLEPCLALTQPELDAKLEAERDVCIGVLRELLTRLDFQWPASHEFLGKFIAGANGVGDLGAELRGAK